MPTKRVKEVVSKKGMTRSQILEVAIRKILVRLKPSDIVLFKIGDRAQHILPCQSDLNKFKKSLISIMLRKKNKPGFLIFPGLIKISVLRGLKEFKGYL